MDWGYHYVADSCLSLNRPDEAADWIRKVPGLRPQKADLCLVTARTLARCAAADPRVEDPAESEYADEAVKMLRLAVERGHRSRDALTKPMEFEPISRRADFRALLEELETPAPAEAHK